MSFEYFISERLNHLLATYSTGSYISDATGLDIETFLPGSTGGTEQITSRISYNEVDLVFYFRGTDPEHEPTEAGNVLVKLCDFYNIPLATNIASAEVLVQALEAGSFNWREFVISPERFCRNWWRLTTFPSN